MKLIQHLHINPSKVSAYLSRSVSSTATTDAVDDRKVERSPESVVRAGDGGAVEDDAAAVEFFLQGVYRFHILIINAEC